MQPVPPTHQRPKSAMSTVRFTGHLDSQGSPRYGSQLGPHQARLHGLSSMALVQASSGLAQSRVIKRQAPPLFDTLETVVLRRQEEDSARSLVTGGPERDALEQRTVSNLVEEGEQY